MIINLRVIISSIFVFGFALGAQAGPAMFSASFLFHAFGNDISTGTVYPYNTNWNNAVPLGHDCQDAEPSTPNGVPLDRYCTNDVFRYGYPATGSGSLVAGGAGVGAPVGLPQSAFSVDVTGFQPTYYPYIQSHTFASFANRAGSFFAGGGPAFGKGAVTKTGMGQTSGTWIIHEGDRGFGGTMGLLGRIGANMKYVVPGKVGTYVNPSSDWNMIHPVGRPQSATVYSITPMGKSVWYNPHRVTGVATNNANGNVSSFVVNATGTPWTTGTVTLYAKAGVYPTIFVRSGYDTVTSGGVRNIQLVTPVLTHWVGPGFQTHTGEVGILKLQITPEPDSILLLASGGGILALLYGVSRRRTRR